MLRCVIVVALVALLSLPALAQFAPFPPAGGATQPQGGAAAPPATGGLPAPAGGFAPPQGAPAGAPPGAGAPPMDMDAYAMMEMASMCQPAIAVENNMIYIASGGMLTIYRLDGNALTKIAEGPYAVAAPMPGMGDM